MATVLTRRRFIESRVAFLRARATALFRSHPRETLGGGVLAFVIIAAVVGNSLTTTSHPSRLRVAPPPPPPMLVRQIAPEQAVKVNAAIPVSAGPNPAATPFRFKGTGSARTQALNCLASAVYYEAGNQDENGERAVAQVVLNRVRHPAFPGSICNVVYEGSTKPTGCQFTFTCDNSLTRPPNAQGWRRATSVAEAALSGFVYGPVGWATHYHANYVVPVWASTMAKNAVVGAHLFYRWAGSWGQPSAFARTYGGHEPNAGTLKAAALAVPHVTPEYGERQLATAIRKIPGAEPLKLAPSLRGDKRVAVRFNLVARQASNDVKHVDYSKQFEVSDNLKWSLSGQSVAESQQPLGKSAAPPPPAQSAVGATGQR